MPIGRRRSANRLSDRTSGLARAALNPERLMEGEDLASRSPEQAQLWQEVYLELIHFESALLATLSDSLALISRRAGVEIRELDLALLEAQHETHRDRLAFWRRRARELQPLRLVSDP
jgi:hypothetical protein